jgi:hypothetical protein
MGTCEKTAISGQKILPCYIQWPGALGYRFSLSIMEIGWTDYRQNLLLAEDPKVGTLCSLLRCFLSWSPEGVSKHDRHTCGYWFRVSIGDKMNFRHSQREWKPE